MAFTRKMLEALGIENNKIDQIMEEHGEVVDALKKQRDQYKADADKLPTVQKELDDLKAAGDDGYKEKYESEHEAFEQYKAGIAEEKTNAKKVSLYRELLESCNIDPQRIDAIIKVTDFKSMKIKDDKLENTEKLTENIKSEWSGFTINKKTVGADVETPPSGNPGDEKDLGSMSMKEYIAARQKM